MFGFVGGIVTIQEELCQWLVQSDFFSLLSFTTAAVMLEFRYVQTCSLELIIGSSPIRVMDVKM